MGFAVCFFQRRIERAFQLFPGMMTESASFRQCGEEEDQADNTQLRSPHSCSSRCFIWFNNNIRSNQGNFYQVFYAECILIDY